jgi:transcriptional regulator with XRE-family HTH domain
MTVGDKLKKIRKELRLTQAELAAKIGIGQQALGLLESGVNKEMSFATFRLLVRNCNVNPYYILTDNKYEPMFGDKFNQVRKKLAIYEGQIDKLIAIRNGQ